MSFELEALKRRMETLADHYADTWIQHAGGVLENVGGSIRQTIASTPSSRWDPRRPDFDRDES